MLDPVIPKDHCTKGSFLFCKEIKKVSSTNKFLISFDICSLFTRIPLNETIDLAVKLIFDNKPNIQSTKKDLKTLFEFATSGTHILFDGNYYDQIDGVAIGSDLGPVLANILMIFYEKQWLKKFNFCKVLLYRRYIDDIICLFNCEVDAMKIFDYLNSKHPNIKFTFEKQSSGKFTFLDILISNENDNFCRTVVHKKTSISLYTYFTSFSPFSYKIGSIKTFFLRAFEISSSWNFFDQEKRKIKNLLMKNLHPSSLMDKEIKTFLGNKFTTKENTNIDHNNKSVSYHKLLYIRSY